MSINKFYTPALNIMGKNTLPDVASFLQERHFKKPLIVTDEMMEKIGFVEKVCNELLKFEIDSVVYSNTKPNPTIQNVKEGLHSLKENNCDCVITLGGGSPHDCGKGIALVATNGGSIEDYEGVDLSNNPQLPLIAINTTAGTASEITRFCIITNEENHVKMAIVDKNVTPILSVNDFELMMKMPPSLTAATGMDALTHAIEAYVSTAATEATDANALHAIRLISKYLPLAYENGEDEVSREKMMYGQLLAGWAFNNASLGYVHAMAHQLGGLLDLPHGLCNAILLPHVQKFNAKVVPQRLRDVAEAMGVDIRNLTDEEAADKAIKEIDNLSKIVGTNQKLKNLGVENQHIKPMAINALKDACGFTNPIQANLEDICKIYLEAM